MSKIEIRTLLFYCILIIIAIEAHKPRSVHQQIPYDQGRRNSYGWLSLLTICGIGFVVNGFLLEVLLTAKNSARIPLYYYVIAFNLADLL